MSRLGNHDVSGLSDGGNGSGFVVEGINKRAVVEMG